MMINSLIESIAAQEQIKSILLILLGTVLIAIFILVFKLLKSTISFLFPSQLFKVINQFFSTYKLTSILVFVLALAEILILLSAPQTLSWLEVALSLLLTIVTSWLITRIAKQFFDSYLLNYTVNTGRKINGELLLISKLLTNLLIIVIAIIVFAQTHQINVFGLVASLGIGGLAIAFAAQKILEQLLAGVVLFLDRPFVVDDYIGLADGSFGRVESIGIRSTRIRTSGKGTIVVVPNDTLTKSTIENFTGAKKIISVISLKFYRYLPDEEKALIRQVIIDCTKDIFGLDARNTKVTFTSPKNQETDDVVHAMVSFFILGSGELSMDLRRQLLDIAQQNINQKLTEYGINFELEEQMINIDSPITI